MAALSDSGPSARSGIEAVAACARHELVRQPLALRAHAHHHRRLRPDVRQAGPSAGRERHQRAVELGEVRARRRPGEQRSHAGAHGLGPERVRAARPQHHGAVAERVGRAQHRAHVARVAHAMQVHRTAGRRARSGASGRPPPPGCRCPARLPARSSSGSTSSPARSSSSGSHPASRAASTRSSPSAANSPVSSRSRLRCRRRRSLSWELSAEVITGVPGTGQGTKKGASVGALGVVLRPVAWVQAAAASRAVSAKRRNVSGSRTAMSASTLRSSSTPASLRPCMKVP